MFELQPLILLLELAKLLEFGGNCRIYVHTLGHDRALARKLAPTRQHERVDVKRLGDIANRDPGKVAQANGGCFELGAVSVCGSGAWLWHLDTPEVRSGCLLNRRRFRFALNELLGARYDRRRNRASERGTRMPV